MAGAAHCAINKIVTSQTAMRSGVQLCFDEREPTDDVLQGSIIRSELLVLHL
jgi:hypothetical protein